MFNAFQIYQTLWFEVFKRGSCGLHTFAVWTYCYTRFGIFNGVEVCCTTSKSTQV